MKDWWLKFGCFLTGYNYHIIQNLSEVAAKTVKRYTSALLIVCILWSFIGYNFTFRYIHTNVFLAFVGAGVFVTIIIQIERQIILSSSRTNWLYYLRGFIALVMAIIGAIIIDQIIFKQDIELEKINSIEKRVDNALIPKTAETRRQISELDDAIKNKELEKQNILEDLRVHPTTVIFTNQPSVRTDKSTTTDSTGKPTTIETSTPTIITTSSSVQNIKASEIPKLDQTIANLNAKKSSLDTTLLNMRIILENDITSKVGFLDELENMFTLVWRSNVAKFIYLIWFLFLLGIEMLVLIGKLSEKESDYDKTVQHKMDLHNKQLDLFAKLSQNKV